MEKKIFTMAWSALLTFLMLFPATLYAQYEGEIGTEPGWQTDTDGSITGTAGTQFIWVNGANFPDAKFRNYVLTLYKANSYDARDGVLTSDELDNVTNITCSFKSISRLNGIEFFKKITSLDCQANRLISLVISQNTLLEKLSCQGNQLTTLNLCNNPKLKIVRCGNNKLQTLDFSNNSAVEQIFCENNNLKTLITGQNTVLNYLQCSYNNLTEFDISQNPALVTIYCSDNNLTKMDVKNNLQLNYLQCSINNLKELDVSKNSALVSLFCNGNNLSELDVSHNLVLSNLYCYNNNLTELDVKENPVLKNLYCSRNNLSVLDCSNNPVLSELYCNYNNLTLLDVSQCKYLKWLFCNDNNLKELDVSKNTNLKQLDCKINELTELDLSFNIALTLANSSIQTIIPNYSSLFNRSKVGIQCHTNTGKSGHYGSFEMVEFDGNNHVIIADGTQDVEFLKSPEIIYNYNTDFSGSNNNFKQMSVAFKTSAYAMYVNPRSKKKDAQADNKKFFGTLYVDYPVVVPAEAECYIGTGIDPSTEQLKLAQIAIAGQVIPALTPFVVMGTDGSGFYVFRGATDEDGTPVTVSGNILAGNLEDTSVTPMSVLTLGIDKNTGELGYWNYTGSTLKAHRAYVPASALSNLSSGSRGLSLAFDDATTTGVHISSVLSSGTQTAENWYTLDGCKLIGKPLQRGVYIHNGKKEIVK